MKSIFALLTTLLTLNTYAVQLNAIELDQLTNNKLKAIARDFAKTFDVDDAGAHAVEIVQRGPSGDWRKTIKQIAFISNPYIEDYYLEEMNASYQVYTHIKDVIVGMAYFQVPDQERVDERLAAEFSDRMEELYFKSDIVFYTGDFEGAFSASFGFVIILDQASGQYVKFYGGYSE